MGVIDKIRGDTRVTVRNKAELNIGGKCVVYWMQHAQRAIDNPALDIAIRLGNELRKPVVSYFAPMPFYPNANLRHYYFLAEGIPDIAEALLERKVGFVFRFYPHHQIAKFCEEVSPCIVIGDEDPLCETEKWRERGAELLRVPFWTIDANVIVPAKLLLKEQFAARTIRPRIRNLLPEYLGATKKIETEIVWKLPKNVQSISFREDFTAKWSIDRTVSPVPAWKAGSKNALKVLNNFVRHKLSNYPEDRNHPELQGTSQLSPYLHFGHLSPQRVAFAVRNCGAPVRAQEAFLEQVIVRRELAVNFVKFNPLYDTAESLEPWANRSLAEHADDPHPRLYSEKQLENAETHDPLWNAAQKQMVLTGWMHNYLRMYWAKKILEWSPSVFTAYQRAVWLNDRYELDGRDPNGYAGIAWAIVGKHDRAWSERPVYGKIRYMSFTSTSRKFDSKKYIAQIAVLEKGMAS